MQAFTDLVVKGDTIVNGDTTLNKSVYISYGGYAWVEAQYSIVNGGSIAIDGGVSIINNNKLYLETSGNIQSGDYDAVNGDAVYTALSYKQDQISLSADIVPVTDYNGDLTDSYVTSTELGYLSGVTSSIQTQLDSKVTGPVSSTADHVVTFDDATGQVIKDSGHTIDNIVKQTLTSANWDLPLLLADWEITTTATTKYGAPYRNNSIYANPSTGIITATGFAGDLIGTSAKTRGLIYLEPTVTTTGVLWSATSSDITSYYDGLMVVVKCPEATATGLTLKINSLTAPTIVYNATSNISTRYAADSIIILTYKTVNNTAYWSIMDYDANTDTKVRQYQVTNNVNYSILARYNTTDKAGTYEATYSRFATSVTLNPSTGQVNATNFNGKHSNLTLTPETTGFTIAGGTTSKTLNVDVDATISDLAPKASPTFTGTVTVAQVLAFSNTSNPYISIKSGSNTYYIQAYDNKLGIGPSWNNSMKIDSSGNVSFTGTPTAPTATAGTNTTQIATTAFVQTAIAELPQAMIFRGTLGTGGTITSLPTAGSTYEGDVYKVITAGTYASQSAKVGDTFICANIGSSTYAWILIPSGDEPSGTVTNIATGVGLTGGAITSTGTIKAKLKSETNATYDSNTVTNTSGRQYAVVPDKTNGYLSVNVPWTDTQVNQFALDPSTNDNFKLLLSMSPYNTPTDLLGATVHSTKFYANPSTGTITASHFYNSATSSSLDFIVGSTFQLTEVD